jgi:hypothetical protein
MDPHILQTATGRWAYLFFTVGVSSNVAADVCRKLTHSNQKTTDIVAVLRFMERLTVRISNLNLSHANQDLPTWERIWKETVIEYNKQTAYDTLELIQNYLHTIQLLHPTILLDLAQRETEKFKIKPWRIL